jgi:hypothetical protein
LLLELKKKPTIFLVLKGCVFLLSFAFSVFKAILKHITTFDLICILEVFCSCCLFSFAGESGGQWLEHYSEVGPPASVS